jgi:hypothetical protein
MQLTENVREEGSGQRVVDQKEDRRKGGENCKKIMGGAR